MNIGKILVPFLISCFLLSFPLSAQRHGRNHHGKKPAEVVGLVFNDKGKPVAGATVYLGGTAHAGETDKKGSFKLQADTGRYVLVVVADGCKTLEEEVRLAAGRPLKLRLQLEASQEQLDELVVTSSRVSQVRRSAFNAVAIDTESMLNSTKNLSDALAKAPGMKLRESGGVGSDLAVTMDGFTGKHVKVFIDGVPQEGVEGGTFGLNNIPVSFAERIEVYRGVVPVGFGTDALGGVVNIVTKKNRASWFLDASYSYGSFNTHKSNIAFGQTFKNGFTYEISAFQNYSDNDYYVDAPVKNFETGAIDVSALEHVKRFNDTYHNEAVVAKAGIVGKSWADRLMLGFTYSHMYKEIQTGVRQKTVFGQKHRRGYTLMPSLEYSKRDLLVEGLDVVFTATYDRNAVTNIDTASVYYNWRGETSANKTGYGEQSYQHSRADNDSWNTTLTLNYRLGTWHLFTFSNTFNAFHRSNTSFLAAVEQEDAIAKETSKNIAGLSYRLMPSDRWNVSVFGKHYHLYVAGPMAETSTQSSYVRTSRSLNSLGYGVTATYFLLPGLQAKFSYEKAYRLPTIDEMFGDEDMESGDLTINPENSDNLNFNLSYNHTFGRHSFYVEGSLIYRDTKDYIQRNIVSLSGNREGASYTNYGKVLTKGYSFSLRYDFARWASVGGNYTQIDVRDNEKSQIGSDGSVANLAYKARMPNVPYRFADMDVSLYWPGLGKEGNLLTLTYEGQYTHSFSYISEVIGATNGDYLVPDQFAHNLTLSYSICRGRYNFSFECRNFTNEKLYDNFSLQKAGRAFYGKIRVCFGG